MRKQFVLVLIASAIMLLTSGAVFAQEPVYKTYYVDGRPVRMRVANRSSQVGADQNGTPKSRATRGRVASLREIAVYLQSSNINRGALREYAQFLANEIAPGRYFFVKVQTPGAMILDVEANLEDTTRERTDRSYYYQRSSEEVYEEQANRTRYQAESSARQVAGYGIKGEAAAFGAGLGANLGTALGRKFIPKDKQRFKAEAFVDFNREGEVSQTGNRGGALVFLTQGREIVGGSGLNALSVLEGDGIEPDPDHDLETRMKLIVVGVKLRRILLEGGE